MTGSRRLAYTAIGLLVTSRLVYPIHRVVYRLTGGWWIAGRALGCELVLLTTTGRRSGRPRTVPLLAVRRGEGWLIVASNGGRPRAPAWLANVRAEPRVTLQAHRLVRAMTAREATVEEQAALWRTMVRAYPGYDVYADRTDRQIPVVVLEPTPAGSGSVAS